MVRCFYLFGILLRNLFDYPLRQLFHWRRKGLRIKNEPKEDLFAHLEETNHSQTQAIADRLFREYHLDSLYSTSSRDNYRENLYYLSMLESAFTAVNPSLPARLFAADIGPSHWFYVQALYAALKRWRDPEGRDVTLSGFEGDAYRVYADFYSRYDHARAHIADLPGVEFIPFAFRPQPAAYDIITLFFPFIFLKDHLEWGLPATQFDPTALLQNAWLSLKPGGLLIIANQGNSEQQKQHDLFHQLNIPIKTSFLFESPLYQYDIPRFITITCREHNAAHSG